MSLSNSIASAMSGLTATSRAAQVVSSNLANATNENYGRRELELGAHSHTYGGGVKVIGVKRHVDPVLMADRRSAEAARDSASIKAQGATNMADVFGTPDDQSSLFGRLNDLESTLAFAESSPSTTGRLQDVVRSAEAVVEAFNTAQDTIADTRARADRAISETIYELNSNLKQIVRFNQEIVAATINGYDTTGLQDQRQTAINDVNKMVPIRELQGPNGEITLTTSQGFILTNHKPVEFEFSASNVIMPHMTAQNGLLGQVSVNGQVLNMASDRNALAGGALQAEFAVRDDITVVAQTKLDALAFEMTSRFDSAATDPSLAATDAGLFTDGGSKAIAANETGLAGRMSLNALVDSAQGGAIWKLQSGLQAATPTTAGDASVLSNMLAALGQADLGVTTGFQEIGNIFDYASQAATDVSQLSLRYTKEESFSESRFEQMRQLQLSEGVDTDSELQRLLIIETNYAANARLLQTVDNMLDALMRIGA